MIRTTRDINETYFFLPSIPLVNSALVLPAMPFPRAGHVKRVLAVITESITVGPVTIRFAVGGQSLTVNGVANDMVMPVTGGVPGDGGFTGDIHSVEFSESPENYGIAAQEGAGDIDRNGFVLVVQTGSGGNGFCNFIVTLGH